MNNCNQEKRIRKKICEPLGLCPVNRKVNCTQIGLCYSSVPNRRVGRNKRAGGKIFWKINKCAGWTFSGKTIIVQVILIFETEKMIVKFILTFLLSYLSQI